MEERNIQTTQKQIAAKRLCAFGCMLFALIPGLPSAPVFAVTPTATELPTNGTVTSGQATITSSNAVMKVTQSTNKAIINWGTFNIGSQAQVNFSQPNASSKTLNRVTGGNSSQIYGKMTANGEVYLINPNGVVIGEGAQITANGVVVSTLDITDQDFGTGTSKFERNAAPGAVVNEGSIITPSEGYVALLGVNVSNKGSISTGKAILAAGDKIEIPVTESGLISIEAETEAAAVTHEGTIKASNVQMLSSGSVTAKGTSLIDASSATAKGGMVSLIGKTVKIKDQAKIKASGKTGGGSISIGEKTKTAAVEIGEGTRLEANATGSGDGGNILLWSNAATTIAGSIFAQGGAEGGNGGFVETSSTGNVKIRDSAEINTKAFLGKTGTWLLDPVTYTIAASGGDETGASVATSLASSNREIAADTIIYVNDAINWSANTLTLTAGTDININAIMTATGTAGLVMTTTSGNVNTGLTSSGFTGKVNLASGTSLNINGHAYTIINSLGSAGSVTTTDLQGICGNRAGYYALGSDIDATETSGWNSGAGFAMLGGAATQFTGTFNGLGHTVSSLTINRSSTNYVGMFGYTSAAAKISNLGLVSASITANNLVGAISGVSLGSISNSYATGSISANYKVGGLVGESSGPISDSYANVNVSGSSDLGGLVGLSTAAITNSYATGTVTGTGNIEGGLVGENYSTITDSYATGNVSGGTNVGGLVGYDGSVSSSITSSHATGTVHGSDYVGGLVGTHNGSITSSWASGNVTGTALYSGGLVGLNNGSITGSHSIGTITAGNRYGYSYSGGLVGASKSTGSIINSYAEGTVTATGGYVGGFVGQNYESSTISDSYAIGGASGTYNIGGFAGYNSNQITTSHSSGTVSGTSTGVGGFVGNNSGGTLSDDYSTATVSGAYTAIGGFVGANSGLIENSYAEGDTSGTGSATSVGGLVGSNSGTITDSHATGDATGHYMYVGGLVGSNTGAISGSYATGNVSGGNHVGYSYAGGLVGESKSSGHISSSYSTGMVTGTGSFVGGFAGYNFESSAIENSYALGSASGTWNIGGFTGSNASSIINSYSAGRVVGTSAYGGFSGANTGTITSSYWNITSSGQASSAGGFGLTTTQMMAQTNFAGWDFGAVWSMTEGASYPYLQMQGVPSIVWGSGNLSAGQTIQIVVNGATVGSGYTGANGSTYILLPQGTLSAGDDVLVYNAGGGSSAANAVFHAGSNVASNLTLNPGTLWANSGSDVLKTSYLVDAVGSLTSSDFLYTISSGDVTLLTTTTLANTSTGGVTVDTGVNWSANTLTISPTTGDININDIMNATGTARLVMTTAGDINAALTDSGFTGKVNLASGTTLNINSQEYTIINTLGAAGSTTKTDLQGISGDYLGYYALGSDIDASATSGWNYYAAGDYYFGFLPIQIRSVLEGLGHKVTNLYINRPGIDNVALVGFSYTGAVIENIGVESASITGRSYIGTLVGRHYGIAEDSYGTGSINANGSYIGGLVGDNYGDASVIRDSFADTTINATTYVGGLVGPSDGLVDNCHSKGTLTATNTIAGGLAAYLYGGATVSNSYSSMNVSGTSYVAGLVGRNFGTITNSHASGTVSASGGTAGGIAGTSAYLIENSYATGQVSSSGGSIGGLVGYAYSGTISGSYAEGAVSGVDDIGGLVGLASASNTIENSHATGNVTASGSNIGGLVGRNIDGSSITNAYATGAVSGTSYVGGLAGVFRDSSMTTAHATGTVTATGGTVGGLIGWINTASGNTSTVDDTYASGTVGGTSSIGGLIGAIAGSGSSITNSHATGGVTGSGVSVGGFAGSNSGSIDTSYATGAVSGGATSVGGFVGYNSGTISNSHSSTGTVHGVGAQVGGLVGEGTAGSSISSSYSSNAVNGDVNYVGGLLGRNYGTVTNSYATGNVTGGALSGNGYAGGLVGYNAGGSISGSHATGTVQSTGSYVGGLVGQSSGAISDSYAEGSVNAVGFVGGLVGQSAAATASILRSHASGTVTGSGNTVGGLVGSSNTSASITDSYATGNVSGAYYVGGLVGYTYTNATISGSYATGTVSGTTNLGGLVGLHTGGSTIQSSYATGNVTGTSTYEGGLVGLNNGGSISNAYALGNISGTGYVGGLVGQNSSTSSIAYAYSIGTVTGGGSTGGLIGANAGTVTSSYWDKTTSGASWSSAGTGLVTADMKTYTTFSPTWSISKSGTTTPSGSITWVIYDTLTYPLLKTFMTSLTITGNSTSKAYEGTAYAAGPVGSTYSPSSYNDGLLSGTLSYTGTYSGATNAGSYAITPTGLYSSQQGYDITYASGSLTITPALLTVTANNQTKTYGATGSLGTTEFTVSGTLYASDAITGVTLTSSGTDATAAAGTYAINAVSATGTGVSNYTITYVGGTLTIDPAVLTITAQNQSKRFGSTLNLGSTAFDANGLVNGDNISSVQLTSSGSGPSAAAGEYGITSAHAVGTGLGNYDIRYVDGILTVTASSSAQSLIAALSSRPNQIISSHLSFSMCCTGSSGEISLMGGWNSPLINITTIDLSSMVETCKL